MIFALTFAWAVYCLKDAAWAFFLAAVTASCGCYLIFAVLSRRKAKADKRKRKKNLIKNFFDFLRFDDDLVGTFAPMLEFFRYNVERIDFENAIATKDKKCLAAFCFSSETISREEIRNAVLRAKRNGCRKILLFCNRADNTLKKFANCHAETEFIDIENTFALFETAEKMPQLPLKSIPSNSQIPKYIFDKRVFGWYFSGAVFTLFTAAISFLKVYLLIWSTVLFVLAFYCLFNKKYNKIPTDVTL